MRLRLNQELRNKIASRWRVHAEAEHTDEKELTYNTALDIVFMNKCHNCGCTPKNDEWSDRAKNLCIDCQDDD